MADVLIWQSRPEFEGRKNLESFIAFARDELTLYEDQEDEFGKGWNAGKWKTGHSRPVAMVFGFSSTPYKIEELFKQPFIEFAKAFVRQEQTIKESQMIADWIQVFRLVYRAIQEYKAGTEPDILLLDALVQTRVEELIRQSKFSDKKKYHFGGKFQKLCRWLLEKRIIVTLPVWKNPFPRGRDKIEQIDEDSEQWREERCPSMHQMLTLADCFAKAQTKKDRYYTSVLSLLCFAPGRGSEISSLTVHSLQEDEGNYYVVWYSAKGKGEIKKWVPTVMVDTVKEAFKRLIEIGRPARDAAKFAFDNPGKFLIHEGCVTGKEFSQDQPLNAVQFASAMGLSSNNSCGFDITWSQFPQKWIKELLKHGLPTYKKLRSEVDKNYKKEGWPNAPTSGRPIWESLCLIRENELHDEFKPKHFSWGIPSVNQINDQISKRLIGKSTLWERFKVFNEDGSEIRMTTHQLRVWLNTHAMNGGMDDFLLAMWSGRADIRQNKAYDARTREEKEKVLNQLMLVSHEDSPSPIVLRELNLPVPLISLGVKRDGVADFTGLGFCVHNFAQSPCTKAGECMTCKEHVCMKGLLETLENLEQLELLVAEQLDVAKAAVDDHAFGVDRWVTHLGWKLAHLRTIIAQMKNPKVQDGALIRIPLEHDPSPTRRALDMKNQVTELGEKGGGEALSIDMQKQLLGIF